MTWKPSVLVVAPTPAIASTIFAWLADAGYVPLVVSSFAAAKQHLDDDPSLLISEVRLGEYNGLHLALRAQLRRVPVILIGEPDPVLQREAAALEAEYLPPDVDAQQLLSIVQSIAEAASPPMLAWKDVARQRTAVSFVSVTRQPRPTRPANPSRS